MRATKKTRTPSKRQLLKTFADEISNPQFFVVEAEVEESGRFFQWRKYTHAKFIKNLGGMYANWCDNGSIEFYRSAYLRDRAYPSFVDQNSEVV